MNKNINLISCDISHDLYFYITIIIMNFNLKQKKSLGQIFLTSQAIVNKIVVTADIKDDEIVLEAGPGKGILTQALLEK
ncbi:hypothetical protein COT82_02340, partial [Candidatus Campbellbacteria bacterium CG10_big_fil_rev_8_21_14_0_10_35_52]